MKTVALKDVAPLSAARPTFDPDEQIWQLNLDRVEAQSGRVLSKLLGSASSAGSSTQAFDEGNVLYSKLRPYLNKVVMPDGPGVATTELVPLRPDPQKLDRQFLTYFLRSPNFVAWASNEVSGAKMPRVVMKSFWQQKIPLPPLAEQKRLGAILDAADALRTKRQQTLTHLDSLLQSTFLDLFGDPVTNPMGWEIKPITETKIIVQIGPFGSLLHKRDYIQSGIPLINPKHIINERIIPSEFETVSQEKADSLKLYQLQQGDIIMGRRGEMGRCAIVQNAENSYLCGTGSLIIRPSPDQFQSLFVAKLMTSNSMKLALEDLAQGQTMPNLNKTLVGKIKIPLPPLPLQHRFAALVEKIEAQKARCRTHLAELDTLFASLQSRAFSGDL